MADQTIMDESDRGSRHYVAWLLLRSVANGEGKAVYNTYVTADRQWVFETYDQCLQIVNGRRANELH